MPKNIQPVSEQNGSEPKSNTQITLYPLATSTSQKSEGGLLCLETKKINSILNYDSSEL